MEDDTYQPQYDGADEQRDNYRERSPRRDDGGRNRSASPDGRDRMDSRGPPAINAPPDEDEEQARNTGSNLFVTGIHPRLSEEDVARLFEKYGVVEKCNIMRDPHTKESRGFGFVNMVSGDQADAAKEALQGEVYEGRTLSIEKARRSKPRTPTPGKYYGPPKQEDFRGPPSRGGRYEGGGRYEERRGYGGGRDDYYRGPPRGGRSYGGGDRGDRGGRYEDRGYDRPSYGGGGRDRYDDRRGGDRGSDRAPIDRYASRDDRYGGSSRGGGGRDYDRDSRRGPPGGSSGSGGYGREAPPPAKEYGSRSYDEPADDRYARH